MNMLCKPLKIPILFLALFTANTLISQLTIRGSVTSSGDQIPLVGATVLIKGTNVGTNTDVDGNFILQDVSPGNILVISYIGYTTLEQPVDGQNRIDVQLVEASSLLDEVVVIAYGETTKRQFTGSLSSVRAEDFEQVPQASPIQLIQGRAAGVLVEDISGRPGSTGSIVIRGVGTLGSSTNPLYVVDGTPTNSIASLNANDIASISVLKDAAASSIYGSRAANGVVLITTKKGAIGKTQFTANVQYGISDIENPNGFRMMNSQEYVEYYREAYLAMGEDPDDPTSGRYLPISAASTNTNWLDEITRTGQVQQYEITASGGTDKTRHYVSLNHYREEGVVVGTDFERSTGRFNFSMAPVDRVNVELNVLGAYVEEGLQYSEDGRGGTYSGAFNVAPIASPFADETTPDQLNGLGYNFNLPSNAGHNPVATSEIRERSRSLIRAFPTFKISYSPVEKLNLTSTASIDYRFRKENAYQSKFYFAETDNGLAELNTEVFTDANFNATAQYELDISPDHVVTPLIGFETYKSTYTLEGSESRDFAFDGINNVAAGAISLDRNYQYSSNTLVSFFSRLNYSFQDKLVLDLSYRRDGSSRFGPENRWGNFYAVGIGYNLIRESFMSSQNLFSELKLRASYGIQGNNDIDDFAWRNAYGTEGVFIVPPDGGGTGQPNSGAQPSEPGNPLLKWEQSESINLGIDFGFLDNRITGSIDLYKRSSVDLLAERLISHTSGFTSIIDNIGDVENKGLELSLATENIRSNDFQWSSSFNISFNDNKIVSLNGISDTLFTGGSGNRMVRIVGQPLDQWYLPQYAGVDPGTGTPIYRTSEGNLSSNINNAVFAVSGQSSLTPDLFGSLSNTFSYKGIGLSFMFYFKYGYEVYRSHLSDLSVPSSNNQPAANLNRWQQPGDLTSIPRADDGSAQLNSTRWLEDGSYIRLRNVTLSYVIPGSISNRIGMSDLRLSIRGVNLLTFTEYQGFNPDTGFFEDDDYPVNRTITFGLSAKF